jgi:ribulose-5-phosphate 4-epimerase/fuculose-1-phosphate aldolase
MGMETVQRLRDDPRSPVRDRVSHEEWNTRCELAAAYQLAAHFRWTDLIYTHFSARIPGTEHLLINPYGLMFDEITASTLVKIDQDGNVIDDPTGIGVNRAGWVIHGCIHQARPEIQCVIHTHTRAGVAVSAQACGLLPLSQHALRVLGTLAYHDSEGIALDTEERTRIARDLGPTAQAMILRNHGLLALGASVGEAFNIMYYLDTSCQIQVDALAGGRVAVNELSAATVDKGYRQFMGPGGTEIEKEWTALVRLLDRKGVPYRN